MEAVWRNVSVTKITNLQTVNSFSLLPHNHCVPQVRFACDLSPRDVLLICSSFVYWCLTSDQGLYTGIQGQHSTMNKLYPQPSVVMLRRGGFKQWGQKWQDVTISPAPSSNFSASMYVLHSLSIAIYHDVLSRDNLVLGWVNMFFLKSSITLDYEWMI